MPFYAALLGMQGERLWLSVGGATYRTSPRMLRELWFGNYTVAWLAPRHYRGNLTEGETNANVGVLRARLARAEGVDLDGEPSDTFGPELAEALERFQVREGLATDRIVGPLTWIALSKREGVDMPMLSAYR
jgi:general secretion pathway protein A